MNTYWFRDISSKAYSSKEMNKARISEQQMQRNYRRVPMEPIEINNNHDGRVAVQIDIAR